MIWVVWWLVSPVLWYPCSLFAQVQCYMKTQVAHICWVQRRKSPLGGGKSGERGAGCPARLHPQDQLRVRSDDAEPQLSWSDLTMECHLGSSAVIPQNFWLHQGTLAWALHHVLPDWSWCWNSLDIFLLIVPTRTRWAFFLRVNSDTTELQGQHIDKLDKLPRGIWGSSFH